MAFRYLFRQSGLNRFHSTDLADMRRALVEDEDDDADTELGARARMAPPRRRQLAGQVLTVTRH